MINIPQQYQVKKKIALKTILSGGMKPSEKKRLRACLKRVHLTQQIQGESIPSFIDEFHRYEVIMFFNVQLDNIKKADSIAPIFQKLFKPPCVIRFYDKIEVVFSFANKRISKKDDKEILLQESVVTLPRPIQTLRESECLLGRVLDFNTILNTVHKWGFYLEVMTKSFIATHLNLYSKMTEFLDTPLWYNSDDILDLLKKMIELKSLNLHKKKAVQIKDKVKLNSQIKNIMDELHLKLDLLQEEV